MKKGKGERGIVVVRIEKEKGDGVVFYIVGFTEAYRRLNRVRVDIQYGALFLFWFGINFRILSR